MGEAIIARRGGAAGEVIVEFESFTPSNTVAIFHPDGEIVRSTPTALSATRYLLAGASVGDCALFAGGYSGTNYRDTVDAYNASLVRSTPTALSVARGYLAGASVGNYALFVGGYSGSYGNTVDAYNRDLVRSIPSVLSAARRNLAGVSVGNYALFAGGEDDSNYKNAVDAYNASLVRSTPTALSIARRLLAGASVGNYALFGGGYSGTYRDTVDAYNTDLVRSTPTALSAARGYLAGASVGNAVVGLPISKPVDGKLWHFDTSLESTDGIRPLEGAVATLRPNEGRFGGAVAVEEGTTNLFSHPNDLSHSSWQRMGLASVTQVEPPPGLATAWRLVEDNQLTYHRLRDITTFEEGNTYTYSVYARGGGGRNLTIQGFNALGVPIARFDLDEGEVFYQSGAVGRIEPVGNGWYRCSMTFTMNEPTVSSTVYFGLIQGRPTQTGAPLYQGDGESYLDLSSPQKELKSFATSFVDGTRPDGILAYPIPLADDYTIACYRKSHTDEGYSHVVKRSDGKVFVDGVEDSGYDVGWIAGRNLILNSSFEKGLDNWTYSGSNTIKVVDYGYRGKGLECVLATSGTVVPRQVPNFSVLPKGEYICQVKIKTDDHADLAGIIARFTNLLSLTLDPSKTIDLGEGWKQYFFTASLSSDVAVGPTNPFGFYQFKAGTVFVVDEIKLERGNKATDWTPAPEDLGYSDDYLMFSNQTGLIDELLILPYAATEDEIQQWYRTTAPFYDPAEPEHRYALFAGGYSGSYRNTVDAYNTELVRSTPTALSVARYSLTGASVGNYALFAGGYDGDDHRDTVDAYNASLVRSTPTALSVARYYLAGASVGDCALFAGGYGGTSYRDTVDAYTPQISAARLYMPVGTKYRFGSDQEQTATTSVVDILPPLTGYIKYKRGVI